MNDPHATGKDVVDREGELVADGPRHLHLEVVLAVDEPAEQPELAAEGDDGRRLTPVSGDEPGRDRRREGSIADDVGGEPVEDGAIGRPDQSAARRP